jgi:hypothetical protein
MTDDFNFGIAIQLFLNCVCGEGNVYISIGSTSSVSFFPVDKQLLLMITCYPIVNTNIYNSRMSVIFVEGVKVPHLHLVFSPFSGLDQEQGRVFVATMALMQ